MKRIDQATSNQAIDLYRLHRRILPVADILSLNEKTIRNILKKNNVPTTPRCLRNRKYSVNENYFEKIDTAEKAYLLGFIWGDGSIISVRCNTQLRIQLAQKDQDVLEHFKTALQANYKIKNRNPIRNGAHTPCSILCITRTKIVNDLQNLGLSANKNNTLVYPIIPEHLNRFFILGLSDSDGCIRIDELNRSIWSLISTTAICNSVQKILSNNDITTRIESTHYNNLSRVVSTRKSDVIKLRDFLYSDESLTCMNRKKEKFFAVQYKRKGGVG
jgi:hypothetical protein